ncbi:MAG: antibiotic biosynthesis monooxygenase [Bacillota bacterium]
MLVALAEFPVKKGKESEFLAWFAWSNAEFAKFKGFISRRLLKPQGEGNYTALIEFENLADFKAVGDSPFHSVSARRILPLLDGNLAPRLYEEEVLA